MIRYYDTNTCWYQYMIRVLRLRSDRFQFVELCAHAETVANIW